MGGVRREHVGENKLSSPHGEGVPPHGRKGFGGDFFSKLPGRKLQKRGIGTSNDSFGLHQVSFVLAGRRDAIDGKDVHRAGSEPATGIGMQDVLSDGDACSERRNIQRDRRLNTIQGDGMELGAVISRGARSRVHHYLQ